MDAWMRRTSLLLGPILLLPNLLHAVIVRGTVMDSRGAVVPYAKVQLVQGKKVVAFNLSGPDGSYEILSDANGRFLLLTSSQGFALGVGEDFYGGRTEILSRDVILDRIHIEEQVTVTATGTSTPLTEISSAVTLISTQSLETRVGVAEELRQSPGVAVVQTGQTGGLTSLFVRGGNSDANKVLIDGVPAEDVGGRFDFGIVSSTGLGGSFSINSSEDTAIELYRGPDSVLYGSDAAAGVVNLSTPRGRSLRPLFIYSGDAGNFHTYRDEGTLSGAFRRFDYYTAYSRFDTSNSIPLDRFHSSTAAVNLGAALFFQTTARLTLHNATSSAGLPGALGFYGIASNGKQADQDLYSGLTIDNRIGDKLHTVVRYGIARKREQARNYGPVGTPVTYDFGGGDVLTEYFGKVVTIQGANGYSATGRASFFNPNDQLVSNRDELLYQTDYAITRHHGALFAFRYENERGSFVDADFGQNEKVQRTNFEYTLQFQGDIKNRLFYSAGGAVEKNHLYGIAGTPRIGLAYLPVWPRHRLFHGTKIRANAALGVQEPSLAIDFNSLYTQLLAAGKANLINSLGITPVGAERSRSYEVGVDQSLAGERLILKADYFHNNFDHQLEGVGKGALEQYFGYSASALSGLYSAYLNSLAFRAQGFEAEAQWRPFNRLFLRGGYTYLDAVVLRSFASDALSAAMGTPTTNPNLPGVAIGAESPLVGAHPFRRPPHTGFFAVQYTGPKLTAAFQGALAGRSDDSTFLDGFDPNFGNSLILPNRDLDFGYEKLDANFTYRATNRVTVFTQLDNLVSQQRIGPIGYPSLPFSFRSGLKFRLGGE